MGMTPLLRCSDSPHIRMKMKRLPRLLKRQNHQEPSQQLKPLPLLLSTPRTSSALWRCKKTGVLYSCYKRLFKPPFHSCTLVCSRLLSVWSLAFFYCSLISHEQRKMHLTFSPEYD